MQPSTSQMTGGCMQTPSAEDVLAVASEQIASFMRDQASSRTLTRLVRHLNAELLGDDLDARERAARALRHMGFAETA